jgi:lysophospholipase L1-like esterase
MGPTRAETSSRIWSVSFLLPNLQTPKTVLFKISPTRNHFAVAVYGLLCFSILDGCAHAQDPAVQTEGASHAVKTAAYEATVDEQGALPSLRIGGQEFLKAEAGIPHGAYLYQDGPVWLNAIEQTSSNALLAKSPKAVMRYEFAQDSVTVTVANATDKGMTYYMVLDPAVDTLFDAGGHALHPFSNQAGQDSTTWFEGKNKLKIEGGDVISGPWNEKYQLWATNIDPGKTRIVTLSAGQATPDDMAKIAAAPANPNLPPQADVASPKLGADGKINPDFERTHNEYLQRIQQGPIGLLFVGDSITNRWRTADALWQERFGAYHPANFGIEGDKTENVLWRFDNGELDVIKPKVVVLLIGTNNIGYPEDDIVKGDKKVVAEIHRRLPDTKVLLIGIFPRARAANDPVRAKIKNINAQLAKLDDGDETRFLDFGAKLLDAEGNLTAAISPDAVHLAPQSYKIWADAMQPLLDEMMK